VARRFGRTYCLHLQDDRIWWALRYYTAQKPKRRPSTDQPPPRKAGNLQVLCAFYSIHIFNLSFLLIWHVPTYESYLITTGIPFNLG
jgi:hypothetical protein